MDICKTDINTITRYLLDAATLYDGIDTTTAYNRSRLNRNLVRKIKRKQENYDDL